MKANINNMRSMYLCFNFGTFKIQAATIYSIAILSCRPVNHMNRVADSCTMLQDGAQASLP